MPIEELADWATASGSCSGGVRAVDVTLDHPLLADGLVLIDTPGVGGLDAAHAEVTEAALLEADALLFVVDADAPMSGPERRFLERVSERLDSVIFALTKVDKWPGRWEGILERNRQELARLSPRYRDCVWLPVSSKDREEARAARGDDPESARYMDERSGFTALEAALREVLAEARTLGLRNRVQLCRATVDSLYTATDQAVAADPEPEVERQLDEAREKHLAFKEECRTTRGGWARDLHRQLETLRRRISKEYTQEMSGLRRHYWARKLSLSPGKRLRT